MEEGKEIQLEANPDHFEGRPYLDRIHFKIFHEIPLRPFLAILWKGN